MKPAPLRPEGHPGTPRHGRHSTLSSATSKRAIKVPTHYSLYGGTHELLESILPGSGVEVVIADLRDIPATAQQAGLEADSHIKMLYLRNTGQPTISMCGC